MMKATKSSEVDYWSAGNFTRHLRDRYSMATLLHYFEATHGASVERSIAAFREVFGDDFAAVEADYLALADPLHAGLLSCDHTERARLCLQRSSSTSSRAAPPRRPGLTGREAGGFTGMRTPQRPRGPDEIVADAH